MLTEDLLVGEEETAVVSGTLEVEVGRTVTATATHSGPRVLAQITTLRRGRREGENGACLILCFTLWCYPALRLPTLFSFPNSE